MQPLRHDRAYGELDQVIRAYLGQVADDTPETRSVALEAYLRHTWHTRPWAVGVAEQQVRDYAHNPPGRLKRRLGEFYPVPDVGRDEDAIQEWLLVLADHLGASVEQGDAPTPGGAPQTHWEWHARFPELGQLLGGWFSQDMPDEFADHDAALDDYLDGTHRHLAARLSGEVTELLALDLDETDYALGLAELGMEVGPPAPCTPGAWLVRLADRLTFRRPDYGEGADR